MSTPLMRVTATHLLPRSALIAVGTVLAGCLIAVSAVRLSGVSVRAPDAPTVASRMLRFDDLPDGSVAVIDARTGVQIEAVSGEQGFLRGSLRGLARERRLRDIGAAPPFELLARADGRLTLSDPATGQRIDLESFGPENAAVFARWLRTQP